MKGEKNTMTEKYVELCRPQIADAISWELIHQIMRRYQVSLGLRLFELHPCSGLYDCLSLHQYPGVSLFDFNLPAQSLHVRLKDRFDIVDDYLRADDPKEVLDRICRTAELDPIKTMPPSNGPVLTTGVMAGLMQANMFSRQHLKFYMGCEDTSGYGGGVRKALAKFSVTRPLLEQNNTNKAYRYYYLHESKGSHDNPLCLCDMAGKLIFRDNSEIELLPAYQKFNRRLPPLISEIMEKIFRDA